MDVLHLSNQLCFPLYALSRQITSLYRPLLEELELTYPQYLVMLVLWEHKQVSVKEIGLQLWLDSGTLTPLLKRLEQKGLVKRKRDTEDERLVQISITNKGEQLRELAVKVPAALRKSLPMGASEGKQLVKQLHEILDSLAEN
ncbi:DNA-binding transcriptional regulator, MarR family [Chitinophaga sp. YR627]|uniref:MarR family winged helix-turn-helix transcriptional regulator n=1 Tax=Chitinophaga sp. YR627 TaxID=1881041 RepID=UPI0008F27D21|nr:MarR family transcriptional regulator [Chitinophaga sp. YR627]SFO33598.1 DNA-binding transcriptional regulator, MarR family [Chitinophaga sp. YR627]